MNAALTSLLGRAAFMHHAYALGVYHPHTVGMILEYSTGELLARAVFMHHDDKGHSTLKHYATLKGLYELIVPQAGITTWRMIRAYGT